MISRIILTFFFVIILIVYHPFINHRHNFAYEDKKQKQHWVVYHSSLIIILMSEIGRCWRIGNYHWNLKKFLTWFLNFWIHYLFRPLITITISSECGESPMTIHRRVFGLAETEAGSVCQTGTTGSTSKEMVFFFET